MTYIDLLDQVFINLYDNKKEKADIRNIIAVTEVDEIEVRGLLINLWEEGFARREENKVPSSSNYPSYDYWISVKGIVFIETLPPEFKSRPYAYHSQLLTAEKNRVRNLETSQLSLMSRLNFVTAWIAVGTIVLVLVELLKLALEHHLFSCR